MELTDKQWEVIEPLIPEGLSGPNRKGRPRRNNRPSKIFITSK